MDKCHSLTNKNVSVGKLLWYEKNITVQDMVLLENIINFVVVRCPSLYWATSHPSL